MKLTATMNIKQQIRTHLAHRPFLAGGEFVVFVNGAYSTRKAYVISNFSEIVSVIVVPREQEAA
jgi:hypothetical protein